MSAFTLDLSCHCCPAAFMRYVSFHFYGIKKTFKIKERVQKTLRVGVASGWAWQNAVELEQFRFLCCFRLFAICIFADKQQPLNSHYGKTNI